MANFSTLFPNLQDNLDFTVGSATGTANQIYGWAQADDTSLIPLSKIESFSIGDVHSITLADDTTVSAANLVAALNADSTTATDLSGETIKEADTIIVTGAGTAAGEVITYVYTGTSKVVGTATDFAAGDFHQLATAASGVTSLVGGTNISVDSATGQVTVNLDAVLTGITSINGGGTGITFGTFAAGDTSSNTNVQFNALNYNVASTGVNFNDAESSSAGFNVNSTGNTSISGNFSSFSGTGRTTIGSSGSETRVAGSALTNPGTGLTAPIGIDENGNLTTTVEVGGGPLSERYAYGATTDTGAHTQAAFNTVVYVPAQSQQQIITLSDGTAPDNGTWLKVINNSGRADLRVNTTQGFLGTGDTFVIFDDTTANVEFIYTADGWAIIAS